MYWGILCWFMRKEILVGMGKGQNALKGPEIQIWKIGYVDIDKGVYVPKIRYTRMQTQMKALYVLNNLF